MVSTAVQPNESQDLINVMAQYQVGDLASSRPAANGIENTNFFIKTLAGNFVLTRLEKASFAGNTLIPLLDRCVEAGLPTPQVIRTGKGSAFADWGDRPVLLCRRLKGDHVLSPTLGQCQALGRFIANFHGATTHLTEPVPAYPRTGAWLDDTTDRTSGQLAFTDRELLRSTTDLIMSTLQRNDAAKLPQGVIHGDLFRDNVLFNEVGLTGVLDFHHAARGFLLFDLAVAVNDWCRNGAGHLDTERAMAMLQAYNAKRQFTRQELWFFPLFLLYAGLVFWLARLDVDTDTVRTKDPAEFQRIVRACTARFMYLDERLF